MSEERITILNWDHRRAFTPIEVLIERFSEDESGVVFDHAKRPLSHFEHQELSDVADECDLVVFDHPFCGSIVESGCFLSLEEFGLSADLLKSSAFIGPSLDTYLYDGRHWGVPIDGATQHALVRADLMDRVGASVPTSQDEVLALGERLRGEGLFLGHAFKSPHAMLSVMSYMTNAGHRPVADEAGRIAIDRAAFEEAYDGLRAVAAFCPPEIFEWNSIELHEAMAARDDVAYAPCVYGYATYGEADQRKPLAFGPFPGAHSPHQAGSMIGGAAFGISKRAAGKPALKRFLETSLRDDVQRDTFAAHHGQPATRDAWSDPTVDARFNGFFSAVRTTMDTAAVRPRFKGYTKLQAAGGEILADALRQERSAAKALSDLSDVFTVV